MSYRSFSAICAVLQMAAIARVIGSGEPRRSRGSQLTGVSCWGIRSGWRSPELWLAKIHDVNIGSEPDVIGQIPAVVIRIFVNDNLVGIPEPVVAETEVGGSHTEREAGEPEARRLSSGQPEDMPFSKASGEAPAFPRTVQMVPRVLSTTLVSYPLVVPVHVRSFGVSRTVGKTAAFGLTSRLWTLLLGALFTRWCLNSCRGWAMGWDVPVAHIATRLARLFAAWPLSCASKAPENIVRVTGLLRPL